MLLNMLMDIANPVLQVWLLSLLSLAVVVVMMVGIATAEVRLFGSSWRWGLAKSTVWGLKVFTQEGESRPKPRRELSR